MSGFQPPKPPNIPPAGAGFTPPAGVPGVPSVPGAPGIPGGMSPIQPPKFPPKGGFAGFKDPSGKPRITLVRYNQSEANELLDAFVFGGDYGGFRVPRGIEPAHVSEFIRERVKPTSGPSTYSRVLDLIRFYERPDVVPELTTQNLLRPPTDGKEFQRQAYACQMVGDFLDDAAAAKAADHFDRFLVKSTWAVDYANLMLSTLLVLCPHGSVDAFAGRVRTEVARLEPRQADSEKSMMAFDKVEAIERNDIPRTKRLIAAKQKIAGKPVPEVLPDLIKTYLPKDTVSDAYLQVWAARRIRADAIAATPKPAHAAFAKHIDEVPLEEAGNPPHIARICASARATVYLAGELTDPRIEKYKVAREKQPPIEFLWDDLPEQY
ncbi:MAG: hypothetical protein KF912_03355 [Phycisphaeraceae bacterium]|nr:hypothetical protein [Phycisphaeraceae bacterium]MBX3366336.1 hypothetical protein [Phycisphaeraceae bacterium]QYK48792.1 MAG: hypothetical protein KF838_02825 [Phycisphaeraceae bacterium]